MSIDPRRNMEITALADLLDRLSYYQLLKVARDARPADIKRAFLKESQAMHPDRFFNVKDPELKERVTSIYKRVAEAYKILKDPETRARYDKQIAPEAPESLRFIAKEAAAPMSGSAEATAKNPQARKFLQLALNCMKNKDFSGAEMNLNFALKFEPANEALKKKLEEVAQQRAEAGSSRDPYKIA